MSQIVFNFTGPVTIEVSGHTTIALPAGESPFAPPANDAQLAERVSQVVGEQVSENDIVTSRNKGKLTELLNDTQYRFRKIGTLAEAIGEDESTTEELLREIDARQEDTNDELWGLISRVGEGRKDDNDHDLDND